MSDPTPAPTAIPTATPAVTVTAPAGHEPRPATPAGPTHAGEPHTAEHRAVIVYPWQRTARTVLAVTVVVLPTLLVVVPLILSAVQGFLPAATYGWLVAAAGVIIAAAGAITRAMATPGVNRLLTQLGLGVVPRAAADQTTVVLVRDAVAAADALRSLQNVKTLQ